MADELVVPLSGVLGCPGAVELLEVLAEGSLSQAELRAVGLSGRRLERVLRTLAAMGTIGRCGEAGSWDLKPGHTSRYALTSLGEELVAVLSDVDLWVSIYETYLYGG